MTNFPELEVERYELEQGPAWRFAPDRRDFFKLLGGGIAIVLLLDREADAQESGGGRRAGRGAGQPQELGAWLHIGEDSRVTAMTGKVEVGQNARTSLTQAVAEELHVAPSSITLIMGDTDLTPFDMGTFGSMTTPQMVPQIRRAAATARELLLDFGAEQFAVERAAVRIENGKAVAATSRSPSANSPRAATS